MSGLERGSKENTGSYAAKDLEEKGRGMRPCGQPCFCCVLMENVRDVGELATTRTRKPDLVSDKRGSSGNMTAVENARLCVRERDSNTNVQANEYWSECEDRAV